ncbi:MAG: hypothetical protein RIT81_30175 [Deltaproteobacteria bacterium]
MTWWAVLLGLGACAPQNPAEEGHTSAAVGAEVMTLALDELIGDPPDPTKDPGQVWLHAMAPPSGGLCPSRAIGSGQLVGTPHGFHGIDAAARTNAAGCRYVWVGPDDERPTAGEVVRVYPDVTPLPLALHATAVQEGNMMGSPSAQALEQARRAEWRDWFLTSAGAFTTTAVPAGPVQVVVIDDLEHPAPLARSSTGVAQWVASHASGSQHGAIVARVVQELSCPFGATSCLVDVSARAALVEAPELMTGAPVGDAVTFHTAVVAAIQDHAATSDPLVLNVSLGAKLDGTAPGVLSRWILEDALELAACNGAVVVASSGNILGPNILAHDELAPATFGAIGGVPPGTCPTRLRPASAAPYLGTLEAHVFPIGGVSSRPADAVQFDDKSIDGYLHVPLHIGRGPDAGAAAAYGHNAVVDLGGPNSARTTGTSISAAVTTAGIASVTSFFPNFEPTDVLAIARPGPKTQLDGVLEEVACFLPGVSVTTLPTIDVQRLLDGFCTAVECGAAFLPAFTGAHPGFTAPANPKPLENVKIGTGASSPGEVYAYDDSYLIVSPTIVDHPLLGPQPVPVGPCGLCEINYTDLSLGLVDVADYDAFVLEVTSHNGFDIFRLDDREIAAGMSPNGEARAMIDLRDAFSSANVGTVMSARLVAHHTETRTWRGSEVAVY